jgi:hypothetical protein
VRVWKEGNVHNTMMGSLFVAIQSCPPMCCWGMEANQYLAKQLPVEDSRNVFINPVILYQKFFLIK